MKCHSMLLYIFFSFKSGGAMVSCLHHYARMAIFLGPRTEKHLPIRCVCHQPTLFATILIRQVSTNSALPDLVSYLINTDAFMLKIINFFLLLSFFLSSDVGIGLVSGNLMENYVRYPSLKKQKFANIVLEFELSEAMGQLFVVVVVFLLLSGMWKNEREFYSMLSNNICYVCYHRNEREN